MKDATGPALKSILAGRDHSFLSTFLTNRKALRSDSMIKYRIKQFGSECPEFPNLSREDIEELKGHLGGSSGALPDSIRA
jgi:hypothetical protein